MPDTRITRRRLLEGMAVAPLALGATLAHAQAAEDTPSLRTAREVRRPLDYKSMDRLGWKLSSQAWTFRELTLLQTVDVLQALGIRYLEMFPGQRFSTEHPEGFDHNSPPERIAELKRKLKAAKITPMNYGVVGLGNDEAENRKVFDFAKTMKLQTIVSEPPEEAIPMIDRLCNEYKINMAIHDHPRPSHYWNPDTVLKVSEGRSHRIGSCADTGHWYRSDLVPLECIRKLRGRIISSHFKDLNTEKEDVPWGTGVCDARGMLEELKRQGFRGVFSVEYERTSGPELVQNVAKSIDWFSRTAGELARSA